VASEPGARFCLSLRGLCLSCAFLLPGPGRGVSEKVGAAVGSGGSREYGARHSGAHEVTSAKSMCTRGRYPAGSGAPFGPGLVRGARSEERGPACREDGGSEAGGFPAAMPGTLGAATGRRDHPYRGPVDVEQVPEELDGTKAHRRGEGGWGVRAGRLCPATGDRRPGVPRSKTTTTFGAGPSVGRCHATGTARG